MAQCNSPLNMKNNTTTGSVSNAQYEPAIETSGIVGACAVQRLGREDHHPHHPQIVEQAQHRVQDADEQQRPAVRLHQGEKDRRTCPKTGQRRQPDQAEQHDRHADGQARRAANQAGVIGDFLAVDRVAQESDDGEGGQIHEQIDGDVDHQRRDGLAGGISDSVPNRLTAAATGIIM